MMNHMEVKSLHKLNCVHTESSDRSASFRCPLSLRQHPVAQYIYVACLCVNITVYIHFSRNSRHRWSFISNTGDSPWSEGGKDGVQTDTRVDGLCLFRDSFLCMVPLMAVSVPVDGK